MRSIVVVAICSFCMVACNGGTAGDSGDSGNSGDSGDSGNSGGDCITDSDCDNSDSCSIARCTNGSCQITLAISGTPCGDDAFCGSQRCEAGACVDGTPNLDVDGDGLFTSVCGGTDCDDQDPNIPNGDETGAACGDGRDNDCDGNVDAFDSGCSGKVCSDDGWCWENPLPHGFDMTAVWPVGPDDIYAADVGGGLLHYRNDAFGYTEPQVQNVPVRVRRMWGSASNDIWALDVSGAPVHFNGTDWSLDITALIFGMSDIHGRASNDVWAVGGENAAHWNGASWTTETIAAGMFMQAVWVADNGDVWAVGVEVSVGGVAYRRTAGVWQLMQASGTNGYAVWGSGPNDVWLSMGGGTLWQWDGTQLVENAPDSVAFPVDWPALSGTGPNHVVVAGFSNIAEWNGTSWSQPSATWPGFITHMRNNGGELAAVGGGGLLLRYNGTEFERVNEGVAGTFIDVAEGSDGTVWAVSTEGDLARQVPGGEWGAFPGPDAGFVSLSGILPLSSDELLVAASGTVYRNDGTAWNTEAEMVGYAMCEKPNGDVVAVGESVGVLSGTTWTPSQMVLDTDNFNNRTLRKAFCLSDGTAWASGHRSFQFEDFAFAMELPEGWVEIGMAPLYLAFGRVETHLAASGEHVILGRGDQTDEPSAVIKYDGSKWYALAGLAHAQAVHGLGDDLWFAGLGGLVDRITPTGREEMSVGTNNDLIAIRALGVDDIVAVDTLGGVYLYDGLDWTVSVAPANLELEGAFIGSADDIFGANRFDMQRLAAGVWTNDAGIRASVLTGTSTSDLYALDDFGDLNYWDGLTWETIDPPSVSFARWTHIAVLPTGDVIAATDENELVTYDGNLWVVVDTNITRDRTVLVGSALDDAWVIQEQWPDDIFNVSHWDGATYTPWLAPRRPIAVKVRGPNDILVVDNGLAIYTYDGSGFTQLVPDIENFSGFIDAVIVADDDIWALSNALLYRYNGIEWSQVVGTNFTGFPVYLQSAIETSTGKLVAVGAQGAIVTR